MTIEEHNSNPRMEGFPPEMYRISGHGAANLEHYIKSKAEDASIMQAVEENKEKRVSAEKIEMKIRYAPKEEIVHLIREAMEGGVEVQIVAVRMIKYAPEKETAHLIREAMGNGVEVQKVAVGMILYAPQEEIAGLIREAMKGGVEVQIVAAGIIEHAPEEEIDKLIREAMKKDVEVQIVAVRVQIRSAPEEKVARLIRKAMKGGVEVQIVAVKMIQYAPERKMARLIRQAMKGGIEVQKVAAGVIDYAPEGKIAGLIREAMKKGIEVQIVAAGMIKYAPEKERAKLRSLVFTKMKGAIKNGFTNEMIKSPLYANSQDINKVRFNRRAFPKTGSRTTLLGGPLKEIIIIRHVTPEAFISWQKAYENYTVWKENDFDYVPIEPIQSYNFNSKEGVVDAYSGVLDLSLDSWENISGGMFASELKIQAEKIETVLSEMNINHGHQHRNIFCLRFFRDKDGNPDLTTIPRLYLIDFDEAISSGKQGDSKHLEATHLGV